jgi:hypothetical protein
VLRAIVITLALARAASADPAEGAAPRTPAIDPAAVMPWTLSARHAGGVLFTSVGGYDTGSRSPVLGSSAEAGIADRVTLRVELSTLDDPAVQRTELGALVDVLRQRAVGIDLAVGAAYSPLGWNGVPGVIGRVAIGRTFGSTRVVTNAAVGAGVGERYGDVRFATLRALGTRVAAGVDARVRFELDRDRDEKSPGRAWDAEAGPTVSYAIGRYAVTAIAGISASKLRFVDGSRVGAIATLGVASVF